MAESTKRIAMGRELPKEASPNTTWADSEVLLYGAAAPAVPGPHLSAHAADYLRLGINITKVDERSGGRWRTFSKGGDGYADNGDAQILYNGYECYPSNADPSLGVEYVVSARISTGGRRRCSQPHRASLMAVWDGPS